MKRLIVAALSFGLALVAAEGIVRLTVRTDADGQRWLGETRLRPYRLPLRQLRQRALEIETPTSLFAYDPDLGWAPRAGARSRDGRVSIDASGARTTGGVATAGDSLRVVALGDSFTFGDEVGDEETWPAHLERILAEENPERSVDVVNLGVNGYGLDQAVLRFERDGASLSPDLVVLGLQPENLLRSLNVVRAIYFPGTSLPFSKPRFVVDADGVRVVNRPAAPVDDVLEALTDPLASPLLRDEGWLDTRYVATPLHASALYSLVQTFFASGARSDPFVMTPQVARVANVALERLDAAVEAAGGRLVVLHLPRRDDLARIVVGQPTWYADWLDAVQDRHEVVRSEVGVRDVEDRVFRPGGHYTPERNADVARMVAPVAAGSPRASRSLQLRTPSMGGSSSRDHGRPGGRGVRMSRTRMVGWLQPRPGAPGANSSNGYSKSSW